MVASKARATAARASRRLKVEANRVSGTARYSTPRRGRSPRQRTPCSPARTANIASVSTWRQRVRMDVDHAQDVIDARSPEAIVVVSDRQTEASSSSQPARKVSVGPSPPAWHCGC